MLLLDFPEGAAEVLITGVDVDIGELGGEFLGYCCGFRVGFGGVCSVFGCDWLVRGDLTLLPGMERITSQNLLRLDR